MGFRLSTLLKLAELKAVDKKTTLLHYVVEVVRKNAPAIMNVGELQKVVRDAARVSLEELQAKKAEAEKGLRHVDAEITWHDEQRLRDGEGASDDDQFPEVFTEFYNWASERKEYFDEALEKAATVFGEVKELLGATDAKEPEEVFDTIDKFVVRFEAAAKELDDARRAAEAAEEQRDKATALKSKAPKKELKSSRASIVPGVATAKRMIGIRRAAAPAAPVTDGPSAEAVDGALQPPPLPESLGAIPQRRLSNAAPKKGGLFSAKSLTQEANNLR